MLPKKKKKKQSIIVLLTLCSGSMGDVGKIIIVVVVSHYLLYDLHRMGLLLISFGSLKTVLGDDRKREHTPAVRLQGAIGLGSTTSHTPGTQSSPWLTKS